MNEQDSLRPRNPLDWVGKRYLSWTAYGLLLLCCSLLQFAPHLFEIGGAKPMLLLPAVVCVAMHTGPAGGLAAGAIAGFVWDIFSGGLLGLYALLLMLIGTVCGLLTWLLVRNNVLSASLMCAAAALVFTLVVWGLTYLLMRREQPLFVLWAEYLPDWLYTAIVSPLIYYGTRLCARILRRRQ